MYGIIVSISILISILTAEKIVLKKHRDVQILWGASFFTILSGVMGARIYNVIDYWSYYSHNLSNIFKVWHGGMGIIGGIITGLIILPIYLKIHKQPILPWLDIVALVLPLGQFIGRWANVANRELLPYAWYEMICSLILFSILLVIDKFKPANKHGLIVCTYLLVYGLVRYFLNPLNP